MKVKFKKLHPDAKVPIYASENAAAFDLYSVEDVEIMPGQTILVKTGLAIEIEHGHCFQFWDRSGLGAKGIHHFAGLGDSDYRGEWKIVLYNSTNAPYKIEKGDRIIQAVIVSVARAEFEEVSELSETKRGEGGFHSTGKK